MDGDGRQIQLARDPLLVVIDLKVDPQVRRGAEEAAEPQRHFDRDGLFLGEDAVNRLARHAKRGGGNNFQFYRMGMQMASVEQLALETSLRKAIFKNEFVVHYQPKMDLASDTISSVEALVRWQHPTMGLLPPSEFLFIKGVAAILKYTLLQLQWVLK